MADLDDQDEIDVLSIFPESCIVVDPDESEEDVVLCESLSMLKYDSPLLCGGGFTHEWSESGNICRVTWPVTEGCSAPCIYVVCGAAYQEDL